MGLVHFVGAGPGDPALLTLRGAELLGRATLVLYDRGLDARVLALGAAGAALREAGPGEGPDDRAALMAAAAEESALVIRLCAGDPMGNPVAVREAMLLHERGVAVEVVPGLLAAAAAPGFSGVPLVAPDGDDAPAASLALGTLADLAGRGAHLGLRVVPTDPADLPAVADALLGQGFPEHTPALVVSGSGAPRQRTVMGDLGRIAERAAAAALAGPLFLLAGGLVAHRARLEWFEARPLFGLKIVVTRARSQAREFMAALEALGADVVAFPVIRIAPPPDPGPLAAAAASVRDYDWVVFTSVNGVDRFHAALEEAGRDARALARARIAAIGPATAAALETWGVRADLVPDTYVAESVLEAMAALGSLRGARVLLPRAYGAREVLPAGLEALGATVEEVEAYRSVPDAEGAAEVRRRLAAGEIDIVTFTSSSTVTQFVEAVGGNLHGAVAACIGPITANTAREAGLPVPIVAETHTIRGLIAALLRHCAQEQEDQE